MAKRVNKAPAKNPVVKPVAKPVKEVKKVALPDGLAATFKAKPHIECAYISGGVWRFNKVFADAKFDKYEVVKNPHFKK